MRAWRVTSTTDADGLVLDDIAPPAPQGRTVIDVEAAGIGFPDLLMRTGEFQLAQPTPFTLGWEAAGTVRSTTDDSSFAVGDRVVTISFGAWADQLAVEPSATFALPDGLSFAEGAAFPLNYFTALAAARRGRVGVGETVLVHGAAGGFGPAAVQVAKARGARVVGTVSTEAKAAVARRAGADVVVVVDEGWRKRVVDETGGGVDVVIDPVGGDRFADGLRCLRSEGRYVVVGFAGGSIPTVAVNRLLLRNVDVCGCTWSVLAEHDGGLRSAFAELATMVADGHLRPVVGAVIPFADAPLGLAALQARAAEGKLVLSR